MTTNDTERRAASLRQLSFFLFLILCCIVVTSPILMGDCLSVSSGRILAYPPKLLNGFGHLFGVSAVHRQFTEFQAQLSIQLKMSCRTLQSPSRLRPSSGRHETAVDDTGLTSNERSFARIIDGSYRYQHQQSSASF